MANQFLHFRIISPKKVLFEGDAESISSKNSVGKFDILPAHANFVTVIENAPVTIKTTFKQNLNFNFNFAILYMVDNKANIYTDIQPFDLDSLSNKQDQKGSSETQEVENVAKQQTESSKK